MVYTVKMAVAVLPATAECKWFLWSFLSAMQVKICSGNSDQRFPQVSSGKLSALDGKLREAFLCVMADLFKRIHVSLGVIPNNLTKIIA